MEPQFNKLCSRSHNDSHGLVKSAAIVDAIVCVVTEAWYSRQKDWKMQGISSISMQVELVEFSQNTETSSLKSY